MRAGQRRRVWANGGVVASLDCIVQAQLGQLSDILQSQIDLRVLLLMLSRHTAASAEVHRETCLSRVDSTSSRWPTNNCATFGGWANGSRCRSWSSQRGCSTEARSRSWVTNVRAFGGSVAQHRRRSSLERLHSVAIPGAGRLRGARRWQIRPRKGPSTPAPLA